MLKSSVTYRPAWVTGSRSISPSVHGLVLVANGSGACLSSDRATRFVDFNVGQKAGGFKSASQSATVIASDSEACAHSFLSYLAKVGWLELPAKFLNQNDRKNRADFAVRLSGFTSALSFSSALNINRVIQYTGLTESNYVLVGG